jgi:hypothetical protein
LPAVASASGYASLSTRHHSAIASSRCQQHCQHAEQKSRSERDHPQRVDRKPTRGGRRIAALCGRARVLIGNSVSAHDASESLNVSVEREETLEDIAAPDKRSIFVVSIGYADTKKCCAGALRSIDKADEQRTFYRLSRM